MKTVTKGILTTLAALLAAVVLVFWGCFVWINSDHARSWIQSRVDAAIPGVITAGKHHLSLVKPSLVIEGVVLRDARGVALAGIDRLYARVDWRSLWRRELRFSHIQLEDPWADLRIDADAGLNLTAALISPGPRTAPPETADAPGGLPVNVVVDALQLSDGRLSFTPGEPASRIDIDGITLSADGDLLARSARLDLSVARLRLNPSVMRLEPARLSLKAHLDGQRLQVHRLEAAAGETRLHLTGTMDDLFTAPLVQAAVSLESRLGELQSVLQLAGDWDGKATAELAVDGRLADPQARLNLTLAEGRIAGQPVDRFDARITLQNRTIAIDAASLRLAQGIVNLKGAVDLREAFGAGWWAGPSNIDAVAYALDLNTDIPDLAPWMNRVTDLGGRLAGRLAVSGRGTAPETLSAALTIDGSADNLLAAGMNRPMDAVLQVTARMEQGRLSISRLKVATDSAHLDGGGSVQWGGALDMNLSLQADDLTRTLAVVGLPSISGGCRATLSARGNLAGPRLTAAVNARDLTVDAVTIGNLTVDVDLQPDGRLSLTTLSLENRGSRIRGNGRMRLLMDALAMDPQFINHLDLTFENVAAADFVASLPMRGTLDGRLRAAGPLQSLAAELFLTGSGWLADAVTIGDIDTHLAWEAGTIRLERFRLDNHGSTLTASGHLRLTPPGSWHLLPEPTFALVAVSDQFDPGDFVDVVRGSFTVNADLAGSVRDPSGRLRLAGRQVRVAGQPVQSVACNATLENRRLELESCNAVIVPGERIDGSGWIGMDRTFEFALRSAGIAVSRIERLRDLVPGDGILRLEATGQGTIDNPGVDGRLTLTGLIVNQEAIDDFAIAFTLHDGLIRAKGNLNFALDAACNLNTGDFEGHLTFDRTETAAYFKAMGQPALHGSLTGGVKAAGNIRDAANMSAEMNLSQADLFYKETLLARSDRIVARLGGQTLAIPGIELDLLSTGRLKIRGDARFGGQVNVSIDGRIPVSAARIFHDALDGASGMLVLTGTLSGDAARPQIDARVDLEQIGMSVPGLVQPLRDLNGRITLAGNRIRIDGVKGNLDAGFFQVDGTLEHDHFTPARMDLTMAVRSLPLEIPDTMAVVLNGDITISGKDRKADARGDIVLLEGTYYRNVKISLLDVTTAATTRQRTVEPIREPVAIPYFDQVNLDISVSHRQPFAVENNLAQLEISPDLRIGGTLANPILGGRAQIRDGRVIFQKKSFEVQKGIIDFVNPYRTEAEVDIQAQAEIRTWRVNLELQGTLDNLAITLTSDPSENRSDILSLILFGQTSRELAAGEGAAQRTTGQMMAEMIADTFGVDIKKTTGLDILQVETADGGDTNGAAGVKVTMGKHLSDRMTVKYAVETKDGETVQRAISEYKLLEHILVSGFQDNRGVYGSELALRIEFR